MDAKKALIITWVAIGLLVAGAVGFFLGRSNFGRAPGAPGQGPTGEQQGQPPPSGNPPIQR